MLVAAAGLATLALTGIPAALVAGAAVFGLGFGVTQNVTQTLMSRPGSRSRRTARSAPCGTLPTTAASGWARPGSGCWRPASVYPAAFALIAMLLPAALLSSRLLSSEAAVLEAAVVEAASRGTGPGEANGRCRGTHPGPFGLMSLILGGQLITEM